MTELQSQPLNNITLSTYMSNTEQIRKYVNDMIGDGVPKLSSFGLEYESGRPEKKIVLSYDGRELGSIDASDFVKDGMISSVTFDDQTYVLTIAWNSDGGSKVTEVNLSGLIDTYTAGEGLTLEDGEFSLTASIPAKMSDLSDDVGYLTEHQSLDNYYQKSETSSASEIDTALGGKQPSGDYAQVSALDHYSFGDGLSVLDNPLGIIPPNNKLHKVVVDTTEIATRSYVDEGHGYTFDEPLQVTDLGAGGKSVSLDFSPTDYYPKAVIDAALSAVREYGSPEETPLSAVVNSIWCLGQLRDWTSE